MIGQPALTLAGRSPAGPRKETSSDGRTRISVSTPIGPFRARISAPLNGRGNVWGSLGTWIGRDWVSIGRPLTQRGRRSR